jgi:GrpB-like predicted nucleotidyltransferase (UPF0157 family)
MTTYPAMPAPASNSASVRADSAIARQALIFRNHLRKDRELAGDFGELKRRLADADPSG